MSDLKGLPSCLIHTHTHTHTHTRARARSTSCLALCLTELLDKMSIAVPAAGTAQSGSGADRGSSRISWVSIMFLSPTKRCQECHHSVSCQTQGDELGPKPAAPKLSPRACLRDGCVEKGGLADRDRGASLGRWTTEGGETEPGVMAQSTRGEGSDGLPLQPLWPHPNPSTRSGCLSGRVFNKQSAVGKPGPERVAGLGEGGWKRDSRPPAHRGLEGSTAFARLEGPCAEPVLYWSPDGPGGSTKLKS